MEKTRGTKHSWDASLYDSNHSFVSQLGQDVLALLSPRAGERIIDIGCGTGELAHELYYKGVHVTGIDYSDDMIEQAKRKYPHISFLVGDVNDLPYDHEWDAVFSNAALHWIKTPKLALHCMHRALKPNGRFVAEFGGKGNVQLITDEIIRQLTKVGTPFQEEQFPWYFPSVGEYTSLMEEAGFRVVFAQHFDRPTPLEGEEGLRNWIRMFAGGMLEGIASDVVAEIVLKVEDALRGALYTGSGWVADYKRIRVVGIKEAAL